MRDFKAPPLAGWGLLVVALALYGWLQVLPLLGTLGTGRPGLASHQNDYKHVYLGTVLLNEGLSPYEASGMLALAGQYSQEVDPRFRTILPYVYLPFTGLVMTPLAWLDFPASVVAFQLLNHVLLLGGMALLAWDRGWWRRGEVLALLVATLALNATVYRQNNAGQLNAVLFGGFAFLAVGLRRGWAPWVIGPAAGFLALYKLTPGLLLVLFLARREWARTGWMAVSGVVGMGLAVGVYGWEPHAEFLGVLGDMGFGRSTWPEYGHQFHRDPFNQSFNALFHRALAEDPRSVFQPWIALPTGVANAATWVLALGVLGALVAGLWRGRRDSPGVDAALSATIAASLLIPSLLWDHYLVQLLVPVVLLGARGVAEGNRLLLVVVAGSLAVAAVPFPFGNGAFTSGPLLLLENFKLLPVVVVFVVGLMCLRGGDGGISSHRD